MALLWGLSGFCTLCMETMWIRRIALWAGNTAVASTLVIAVFFAAAAAGNWWGGRLVARTQRPLRFFGLFEMAAGVAAVATYLASAWLWRHLGVLPASWTAQLPAALLLVGPPAFCSGVAFPSLAESYIPNAQERTSRGAPFYGWNLLGAAAGVAAGGVWLPLAFGFGKSFAVVALLQIAAGLIAWRIARVNHARPAAAQAPHAESVGQTWRGTLLLAASGALSLAAQALALVWARQLLDGSIYTLCGVLTAFLGGLGLGALAVAAGRRRGLSAATLLRGFAGLSALLLFLGPAAAQWLFSLEPSLTASSTLGLLAQAVSRCALVLTPLAFALGGVFPLFWEMALPWAAHEGRALGMALALNKLGAAAGIAGGLFLLLPALGLAGSTLALGWAYLLLAAGGMRGARTGLLGLLMLLGGYQCLQPHPVLGLTA
jgi:predicted membrane-bound spermidine synthase